MINCKSKIITYLVMAFIISISFYYITEFNSNYASLIFFHATGISAFLIEVVLISYLINWLNKPKERENNKRKRVK